MGGGRVGKKRLPTDMGVMLRIGKAKTSTKITFVAVLRLKPPKSATPPLDAKGFSELQSQPARRSASRAAAGW